VWSGEMASFRPAAALPSMCSTCALTALVAALWCGCRHHLWFHLVGAACGWSLSLGVRLWVGLRRKPLPACWPMMATPLGAIFLLGGIIRLPLLPPCPQGWSFDQWFILYTCLASFYILSS